MRGFTLTELLVFILVVALLSSIILSSVIDKRDARADESIRSLLVSVKARAELLRTTSPEGIYGYDTYTEQCTAIPVATSTTLFADPEVHALLARASKLAAKTAVSTSGTCAARGANYFVAMPLKSDGSRAYCMDHTGDVLLVPLASITKTSVHCAPAPTK